MRILKLLFVILAMGFSAVLFPESVKAQSNDGAQVNSVLMPWIGVWTIIEDRSADRANNLTRATVEIRPTTDGKGLEISRKMPQPPDIKEVLIPDGTKRPVDATDCSGWQTYRWDAGLILGSSEMTCKESGAFATSSLKMILESDQMVDILAIKAAGQKRLAVRRLAFDRDLVSPGGPRLTVTAAAARMAVSGPWSINRILELSKTVDTAILEAALIEKNVQLKLTSKSLKQLKDTGISTEVIDLLVALAFPDQFDIRRNGQVSLRPVSVSSSGSGGSAAVYYPPSLGYYPGAFYNCYSPYSYYGYMGLLSPGSCWGYYSPFWWDYPVYFNQPGWTGNTGPGWTPPPGQGGTGNNGQLTASGGYVQIVPVDTGRHARPREGFGSSFGGRAGTYVPGSTGAGYSAAGASSAGASSGASSSGSGYSSSSGSTSSGASAAPSASPGGYSSGSSGGPQAGPR
jgi:hypothetical protein